MKEREIIAKEWRDERGILHCREVGQELVRCKECKWRGEQTESGIPYYWCRLVGVGYEVPIEHYCSYGEREGE